MRGALDIREEQLGTETRQYDSEDGTQPSRVKKSTATRVLPSRSVSSKKTPRPREHEIVDLDVEDLDCGRTSGQASRSLGWG